MRTLLCLLLLPLFITAQTKDGRQLVALTINSVPDRMESENEYYLMADLPAGVKLKPSQTFLLQSSWQKEGDSVVNIGAGTVRIIHNNYVELTALLNPGKKVRKGDMAMFLVPMKVPAGDTLFFKMARHDIAFKTVDDSLFYNRNIMLSQPESYPTFKILDAMAKDIRFTGKAMAAQNDGQDRTIKIGQYRGQKLFALMQKITAADVLKFIRYVYARPDKYKAHTWKVSETFATWVISGSPEGKKSILPDIGSSLQ